MKSAVLLVCVVLVAQATAIRMNRCQIVQALKKNGFPANQLRNWVCLVEHESGGRTDIISKVNSNGSRDHGLFQINDKYWCTYSGPAGKDCHATCASLRTNDIGKASTCAKLIYKRHGFNAWYGWKNHCRGTLPDISKC